MATVEEIRTKLTEYEAATADREAKQTQHQADLDAMNAAVTAEAASRQAWVDAIRHENAVEDELEVLVIEHEPPAIPE